jgi:hypothetical protein
MRLNIAGRLRGAYRAESSARKAPRTIPKAAQPEARLDLDGPSKLAACDQQSEEAIITLLR